MATLSLKFNIYEFVINIGFYCLFYLFCYNKIGFIAWRPLLFLGMISYSLYLVHCNIGMVIIRTFNKLNINPNISVIIAIASTLLLAWLINYSVEKPVMRVIRKKYKEIIGRNAPIPLTDASKISGAAVIVPISGDDNLKVIHKGNH
jgi:peptidoglycan/LPS O-acetylase OafA/YrhL